MSPDRFSAKQENQRAIMSKDIHAMTFSSSAFKIENLTPTFFRRVFATKFNCLFSFRKNNVKLYMDILLSDEPLEECTYRQINIHNANLIIHEVRFELYLLVLVFRVEQ